MSPSLRVVNLTTVTCLAFLVISACSTPAMGQGSTESPLVYHTWESFTTRDGLPHNGIRAIHIVDGRVWVGTEGGLALYDGRTWRSWTRDDGLPSPVVTAIDVDAHTDELWLGMWGGGLVRFSAGRFDTFDQYNSGLAGNLVLDVRVAGGRVWASTSAGLSSFDPINDTWELYVPRRADTPETAITGLTADGDYLYAAGWGQVVHLFDLNRSEWVSVSRLGSEEQTGSAGAPRFREAAVGITSVGSSTWVLTQERLFRREGTLPWKARSVGAGPPEAANFIRCLAANSETEAWVGTNDGLRGLVDWSTDTWVRYRRCESGDEGLTTLTRQGQTVAAATVASTLPDNRIRCIAFGQDAVWVGTVNGLARGTERKRWSALPARADGAKTTCPQPATTASSASKSRGEPALPDTVTIAVLGPIARIVALPGGDPREGSGTSRADLLAVQLAVNEVNARGGYRGRIPFRVAMGVGAYERYGWGTAEDDFATFLYRDHALGVVAYLGPGYIIRNTVAFQTEIPLINAAGTLPGFDGPGNPWIFRCPGDDPRHHRQMVDYIVDRLGYTRFALLRTPGVQAQRHLDLWSRYAGERGLTDGSLVTEVRYHPDTDDLDEVLRALRRSGAEVVLTWCDVSLSARVLRRMREVGMSQLFVGGEQLVSDEFVKLAGRDPGSVIAPYPCPHRKNHQALARFAERYTAQSSSARMQRPPTVDAYLTYHAAKHLLLAINMAGLDREAIRQVLTKMGDITVAKLKKGVWEQVALPDR
ncbi:MAG: ABC transporter substrate-binding protein [Phycisphaerae bacterium]